MSDTTLNRFLAQGTNAERLAFTPDPPSPASGPDPGYLFFETDTLTLWAWDDGGGTWSQVTGAGFANPMTTSQDLIVGGVSGTPGRLGVGSVGDILTVGSGGVVDWETPSVVGGSITTSGYTMATNKVLGRATGGTGAIEELSTTGSGNVVLSTSPTLVTPALGTPSAIVLTNATGVPAGQIVGVIPIANLATGTPTGSKFIRDDGVLAVPAGGGSGTVNSGTTPRLAYYATSGTAVSDVPTITVTANGGLAVAISGATNPVTITNCSDATTYGILTFNNVRTAAGMQGIIAGGGSDTNMAYNVVTTGSHRFMVNNVLAGQFSSTGLDTASVTNALGTLTLSGASGSLVQVNTTGAAGYFAVSSAASGTLGFYYDKSAGDTAINFGVSNVNKGFVGIARSAGGMITGSSASELCLQAVGGVAFSADNGTTMAGQFVASTGQLTVLKNITSTSTTTGSLVVTGGVGISQNLWVGGTANIAGTSTLGTLTVASSGGDVTITNTGANSIVIATAAGGTGGIYLNKTGTGSNVLNFQLSGVGKSQIGVARSGGDIVTGSSANDLVINAGSANTQFSTDNGTTICLTLATTGKAVFANSVKTGAPSGGTAAEWKFGVLVTAAVTPDTTRYIQLDVGGTLFKVIIAT